MTEGVYQTLIGEYLSGVMNSHAFVDAFDVQWKSDRDNCVLHDPKVQRAIDQIFTACDCYSDAPLNLFDVTADQLRKEVAVYSRVLLDIEK